MTFVPRPRILWTPAMEDELMLCNDITDRREYAARMGLSLSAVDGRYYKLKRLQKEQAND